MSNEQTANQEQLLFTIAEHAICIPISDVQEILSTQKLRSVPFAPSWLIGLINVRSEAWPVVDLHHLALPNSEVTPSGARAAFIALTRQQIVLAVDAVQEIKSLHASHGEKTANKLNDLYGTTFKDEEDKDFQQLSVEALLAQLDLRQNDDSTLLDNTRTSAL
jgi:chemotaxis signal transduction protein